MARLRPPGETGRQSVVLGVFELCWPVFLRPGQLIELKHHVRGPHDPDTGGVDNGGRPVDEPCPGWLLPWSPGAMLLLGAARLICHPIGRRSYPMSCQDEISDLPGGPVQCLVLES